MLLEGFSGLFSMACLAISGAAFSTIISTRLNSWQAGLVGLAPSLWSLSSWWLPCLSGAAVRSSSSRNNQYTLNRLKAKRRRVQQISRQFQALNQTALQSQPKSTLFPLHQTRKMSSHARRAIHSKDRESHLMGYCRL